MSDNEFDETVPEPSEQLDQLQADDTLIDRGVDDVLDEGLITADRWRDADDDPPTIEQRLREEQPDPDSGDDDDRGDDWSQVGRDRAGRLVAPEAVAGQDAESELYGEDAGFAGGAASAEEAAVHVIDGTDDAAHDGTDGPDR